MRIAILCLTVLAAGCVSRGSTARKLTDDVYEVRAWDGYGCRKDSDNKTCFTLLMPVIKDLANQKCEDAVELIPLCTRYEAASADRIVCRVHCKDSEEEDEGENENPPPKGSAKGPPKKKSS